jgi:hypothetical protein
LQKFLEYRTSDASDFLSAVRYLLLRYNEYAEFILNLMRNTRVLKSQAKRFTMLSLIVGAVLISFSGVWVKVAHVTPNVSAFCF